MTTNNLNLIEVVDEYSGNRTFIVTDHIVSLVDYGSYTVIRTVDTKNSGPGYRANKPIMYLVKFLTGIEDD